MNKREELLQELSKTGKGKMKCFGSSMMPIIKSGSLLTFQKCESYDIGDIVFCKVKGRYIDAHKITKKNQDKYMIANNKGHENGWTKTIYAKVIAIE